MNRSIIMKMILVGDPVVRDMFFGLNLESMISNILCVIDMIIKYWNDLDQLDHVDRLDKLEFTF